MPVGYLITVAIVAIGTLCALAPLPWEHPLGRPSYIFGLAANELPFAAFFWMLLLPTALAFAEGDIDSPAAWAIVGLAAVTVPGLAVIAHRAWGERDRIERAMAEGLGDGWRATIAPDLAEGLQRRLPWARILVLPIFRRRWDVRRVANLAYGDAGRRNRLDVYHHRSRPEGAPVLIHMHGGHYSGGHKNSQSLPLLHRLAGRGWVTISANYRLKPHVRHPDHLIDLKKTIAWAREHAQEYGADPSTLFVAGSSAGGHMASIAALTPNDPAFQPGFEDAETSVSGAIILNGFLGSYWDQGPESSPLGHARPDAPPILIAHGDLDPLVPAADIRAVADELRRASSHPVVYAELRGGHHAFDLYHSLRFEALVDAIEAFTAWARTRERTARP
ncbi:Acetyl esterase/lipase [Streptomyces sp. LamerLS-316]|uniref:alpha/beta hydrolase n=1 Tax=unclassified Streptomyces TaxID=2593676 RepID=UPI000823D5FF|nr:alpha/beta hydrolase [Streptomyces sp. LamerLS-316]MYQ36783.1 alpha/beta hydrolase fold domain-containing protein [Streptomyces sp. SID4921]SCK51072.1 Acetyl esterase/lipase [Streptomyces sp. LamerLS-316]